MIPWILALSASESDIRAVYANPRARSRGGACGFSGAAIPSGPRTCYRRGSMSPRASLLLVATALLACNSDDLGVLDEPDSTGSAGSSTSTTAPPTTGELSTTTTTTGTTTGEDPTDGGSTTAAPEPPPTCGELLDCVLPCALSLDLGCAQKCAQGLDPGEAIEAFQLGLCVGMACFESGACSTENLTDPICLACIGFLIMDDKPKGCEAEAEACAR